MKKYEPLEVYLKSRSAFEAEVNLTFREVEKIIGAELPASAIQYREWWSNQKDHSSRPQAKAWLNAGWVVETVKQSGKGLVRFQRKQIR